MKIYNNIRSFKAVNPVLTLGAYDGVHRGHLKILEFLKKSAASISGESVILTFDPHPRKVLFPNKSINLLTTIDERIELFRKIGIDRLLVLPFTKEFSQKSSYNFVKDILFQKLRVKQLIVGYDHHFGKDRLGDVKKLREYAANFNIDVNKVDVLNESGINISSTKIREALIEGKIDVANNFLGYDYFLTGKVVDGEKIGRKIGFPTANIQVSTNKLLPKNGVYAVDVKVNNKEYKGMLNIGNRPTIKKGLETSVEVHIFDFDKCIYESDIFVSFIEHIRNEKKFNNINHLTEQLIKDKEYIINNIISQKEH